MTLLEEKPMSRAAAVRARLDGLRPPDTRWTYLLGFAAAIAVHGLLILFWPKSHLLDKAAEFDVERGDASVEVSLVAALPAEEEQPKETPPDPMPPPPPPPEQKVEPPPPPPPPEKPPEMTIPEPPPAPPQSEPKPQPPEVKHEKPPPAPREKPRRASHPVGDGSAKVPGNDATTAHAASGALGAKPAYLRNPHPAYPEEARAAHEQGVVTLHVNVDASGHVTNVRVVQSSGFPILDERARSTVAEKWVFKPAMSGGAAVASEVMIPIRFTLER